MGFRVEGNFKVGFMCLYGTFSSGKSSKGPWIGPGKQVGAYGKDLRFCSRV